MARAQQQDALLSISTSPQSARPTELPENRPRRLAYDGPQRDLMLAASMTQ
jgi:hypothetical protein